MEAAEFNPKKARRKLESIFGHPWDQPPVPGKHTGRAVALLMIEARAIDNHGNHFNRQRHKP